MGQFDDIIQAGSSTRNPIIPPGAAAPQGMVVPEKVGMSKKGKAVKRNLSQQLDASFGLPASRGSSSDLIQPAAAAQANVEQSKIKGTAAAAQVRTGRAVQREKVLKGLSTTTMRLVNGQAVDMDEVNTPKANPISGFNSKGYVKPTGIESKFTPIPRTEDQVAEIMNPGKAARDAKSSANAETEATRQDMLSGEAAFNKKERSSGSTTRSVNGITYDTADMRAETMAATGRGFGTYDDDLKAAARDNDVIPKSTTAPKKPVDPENQDNYRPSSIVPTAPQLENLGNSEAVENKDVDNYDASKKEGKIKQTTKKDAARLEGGAEQTVTDKVKPVEEKEPFTIAGKNDVDTDEAEQLRADAAADFSKTRSEKGMRNPKAVKVDSRTVPFDQQDLLDKDGNVKPEYQEGPSSTTMTAKKNWNIQPIYKSPELQAKHEKRQKYAEAVGKTIESESLKHLDTDYASGDESKAAFARMQTRHAGLRANVDKYHPVPAGGYFNENVDKDTSTTSYEEMPGVKVPPSPQPQNVKDNSGVIPERLMNQPEEVSDAQLAVDDRASRNNRTSVTRTRQLTFNNIASRPTRGRTREQEAMDLVDASERNQKLESQGKSLQTHSPEVMLRARISADNAGISPSVYNSPTFHQSAEGRVHVRDAYLRHTAAIGDDKESSAKMDKFIGGNANEASDIKEGAYKLLQNRERFNNSKKPGTGYRYNAGLNNLDIKTDKFRASNGQVIPMSQTDHPEHPGFDLEGSHVGFKGSAPTGANEDGTTKYESLTHPQTGEDLHEGWHPYTVNGQRVFEKHSIPKNAIHHGDIIEQGMQTGESGKATLRKLIQGKESEITANGLAINLQPSASEFVPTGGTTSASKASRESHATIAGTFIPPTPRRGRVGTGEPVVDGELPTRPITAVEKEGKRAIPSTDDSKTKVFSVGTPPSESSDIVERTKVGPKPEFHYGHGSLEDISAAHAGGHIDGDTAYELAADAGYFKVAKPKFTKDEE